MMMELHADGADKCHIESWSNQQIIDVSALAYRRNMVKPGKNRANSRL